MLTVTIASHLEPEHIDTIRAVDPGIRVLYDPALVGAPRYEADHSAPINRTPAQAAAFAQLLAQADVIFDFDRATARDLPKLAPRARWLQATSAGIGQFVAGHGLQDSGITFCTASGVHARPLADFCSMAMLMFAKGYFLMLRDQQARRWERTCAEELTGKTVAVIGLGRIGREVARQAHFFEMRVIGTSRSQQPVPGVERVYGPGQLDALLPQADFVVLIAPHTPETDNLLSAARIARMRRGAVLINIARGSLVDEPALIDALRDGHLGGAALDVFREEPLPAGSPLWAMPNVIISPHSASTVRQENARIVALFCDNLRRHLGGLPLRNVLDVERYY